MDAYHEDSTPELLSARVLDDAAAVAALQDRLPCLESPGFDATKSVPSSPSVHESTPPRYTRRELTLVFLWLLGGDFAFTFFEQIFGRFIPLFAKDLHGSNTLIGLMTGSFAGLANLFLLPIISVRSDRRRGRLGRRIPLLLWAAPATVISLLLVGFAPEISLGLQRWISPGFIEPTALTLGVLCLFVVSYHLWNMVLVNAYNWLIRDVVPTAVIGRFLAWFRVVGTVGSFLFLWYVFPEILVHRQVVFVAVGASYTAIFLLMCWQVREGEYPPAPHEGTGLWKTFARYFQECLSLPIYRNFFLAYVLMVAATATTGPFLTLFARNTLGLNMDDMGKIFAVGTLAGAFVYPGVGWLCDRFKPIRLVLLGIGGQAATALLAFLCVHDRTSWWLYIVLSAVPACTWALGSSALTMELFPPKQFGQFSAGLNVFGYGGVIAGNYLMGVFMDYLHSRYQMAFVWSAALTAVAVIPMFKVYHDWKEHGGPDHYVPPLPSVD